jgi:hypothetical protein
VNRSLSKLNPNQGPRKPSIKYRNNNSLTNPKVSKTSHSQHEQRIHWIIPVTAQKEGKELHSATPGSADQWHYINDRDAHLEDTLASTSPLWKVEHKHVNTREEKQGDGVRIIDMWNEICDYQVSMWFQIPWVEYLGRIGLC